jgi:hypothetical protein
MDNIPIRYPVPSKVEEQEMSGERDKIIISRGHLYFGKMFCLKKINYVISVPLTIIIIYRQKSWVSGKN